MTTTINNIPVYDRTAPPTPTTSNGTSAADLSKNFLKMLTVQLQNQDPMNPMKDTEFIAQMANFSSLEQMRGLSQSFTNYSNSQQMATAPLYLGCEVTVKDTSAANGEIKGKVESVTVKDGAPALMINGKTYDPKLITNISLPPQPITPPVANPDGSSTLVPSNSTN